MSETTRRFYVEGRIPVVRLPRGKSLTKQSFRNETDINAILRKYEKTGVIHLDPREPLYGDFSAVGEYQGALERVRAAEAAFMALPAKVREHVANDPEKLIELWSDPERRDELRELGVFPSDDPKAPPPQEAETPLSAVPGPPKPSEKEAEKAPEK